MLKLLGMLDLSIALFFILVQWDIGLGIATVLGILFLIKSLIFIYDWTSVIDVLSGIYQNQRLRKRIPRTVAIPSPISH